MLRNWGQPTLKYNADILKLLLHNGQKGHNNLDNAADEFPIAV